MVIFDINFARLRISAMLSENVGQKIIVIIETVRSESLIRRMETSIIHNKIFKVHNANRKLDWNEWMNISFYFIFYAYEYCTREWKCFVRARTQKPEKQAKHNELIDFSSSWYNNGREKQQNFLCKQRIFHLLHRRSRWADSAGDVLEVM